jgi:anti-sigma factor (TIGR02949 family)
MKCADAGRVLEAYLDGELDRADVDELEAHLTRCEQCRAELASLEDLRAAIKAVPRYRAPRALRQRLEALDGLPSQLESERRRPAWTRWSLAASVLVAFAFGAAVTAFHTRNVAANTQQQAFAQDLLNSHLRALAASSPVDVVSEDRHTVKPWFAGKVDLAPSVQDFSAQGFPLIGGRIDYVGGQRTPVVVYRRRQHVIDVYWATQPHPPGRELQLQGYWLTPCSIGDRQLQIAADIEHDELLRFCELLRGR